MKQRRTRIPTPASCAALLALCVLAALPVGARGALQEPGTAPVAAAGDEDRLNVARRHAWKGRLPEAIALLRQILDEAPGRSDARIELARYLSWSGAPREAIGEADRVLASEPDNREALRVKADAASWQGDFATSLPLYRRALAIEEDAELRAAYAHALLGAGYLREAGQIRDGFAAGSPGLPSSARAALDHRAERLAAPAGRAGASHYEDSDGSRRNEARVGGVATGGDSRVRILAEKIEAEDKLRRVDAERLTIGIGLPLSAALYLEAAGGIVRVDDHSPDTYAVGLLRGTGRSGPVAYQARLEHSVFDETALILENRIRRTELETLIDYSLSDRLRMSARYEFADYSDDNTSHEFELTPQIVLWQGDPGVRLGYRRTHLSFDRQSGGGYFDPDRLDADRLMLFVTSFGERLRWDFELFAGRQVFERFGREGKDDIAGGSARLSVDLGRRWTLEAELEGGNFALQSAGGFRYSLLSLDLIGRF